MKRIIGAISSVFVLLFALGLYSYAAEIFFWGFDDDSKFSDTNVTSSVNDGIYTAVCKNNDPRLGFNVDLNMNDYSELRIRMKYDLTEREDSKAPEFQCFFVGTKTDGTSIKLSEANSVKTAIGLSSGDGFAVHSVSLDKDFLKNAKISKIYLDPVNCEGSFSIDYFMFVPKGTDDALTLDFDKDPSDLAKNLCGWSLPASSYYTIGDGTLKFTDTTTKWANPRLEKKGLDIDANSYSTLEVIMKHNLKSFDSRYADMQLYYSGTNSSGTAFAASETNSKKQKFADISSGDNFRYYKIDLSKANNWQGSSINTLRFDPMNDYGDFEIDLIRFVPSEKTQNTALDESLISLEYSFDAGRRQSADGTVKVNFGSQNPEYALSVKLYWAQKDGDTYSALPDYTPLRTLTGTLADIGYAIRYDTLIPDGADALAADITDSEKTFSVYFDIPESKKAKSGEMPIFTAAVISDIHIGGWGSTDSVSDRLLSARQQINDLCDFTVINGDLTQWYGAYSEQAFMNYHDSSYNSNGETSADDSLLHVGTSQWELLTEYLKGFEKPVYAVQGNHDIADSGKWNPVCCNRTNWDKFLKSWIDYSNTAANTQKYENAVTKDDGVSYYDTVINGYEFIFLEIPRGEAPYYSFGDAQLEWLDKKLSENDTSGKPVFVFGHVPTETELSGGYWDAQLKSSGSDAAIKAVLQKHPSAIYTSGHTHFSLDTDFAAVLNGNGTEPTYMNDGGMATVCIPKTPGNADDCNEVIGSEGLILEVYSDRIVVRSRSFTENKWISRGLCEITFAEKPKSTVLSAMKSTSENGKTQITAITDLEGEKSFTWYLGGKIADVSENSIEMPSDFDGSIFVKLTESNGAYRTLYFGSANEITEPTAILEQNDIRTKEPFGLRFIGFTNAELRMDSNAVTSAEYGFVVGLESALSDTEPRLGMQNTVSGAAYSAADGTDKFFKNNGDNIYFAGAMTRIPQNRYDEKLKAACYIKLVCGNNEYTLYSKSRSCSVSDVLDAMS